MTNETDHITELDDQKNGLPTRSKFEIGIEAAMQLIPYGIGSALAVVYFGGKAERRFLRIESFYQAVADDVEALGEQLGEVLRHSTEASDPERLASIVEELNDRVEVEALEEKRGYYRRYFENALLVPVTEANYEERRLVLDVLSRLTPLQLQIVAQIARDNQWVDPKQIAVDGIGPEVVEGAVGLLKSYGVLEEVVQSISGVSGVGMVNQSEVHLSGFGYRLHALCVQSPKAPEPPVEKKPFDHFRVGGSAGMMQSVPYELSDEEVEEWLTASPLRGVPAREVIEAREERLLTPAHTSTTIQLKPTVPGRWVVRWQYREGEAPTIGRELEMLLAAKDPGYIAAGEAPFRHTPESFLGGGMMKSDTFILTDDEVGEVVRRDFAGLPQARQHFEENRALPIQDGSGSSLNIWPSQGLWIVDWHRKDGVPLRLPAYLRSVLEGKEPHVNPAPEDTDPEQAPSEHGPAAD